MSDACKLEMLDKFGFLEDGTIAKMEEDIRDLEEIFKSDRNGLNKAIEEYSEQAAHSLQRGSINSVKNQLKVARNSKGILGDGDFKNGAKRFFDLFAGRNSVETTFRSANSKFNNMFRSAMKREGLEQHWHSGKYDKEIYIHNNDLANGRKSTASAETQKMAVIVQKLNDQIYNDLRLAGLDMKYRRDFLVSRNYDAAKIREMSNQQWLDTLLGSKEDGIEGILDIEGTFNTATLQSKKVNEVLLEMKKSLEDASKTYDIADMLGQKTYMNKLKGRKLEFKDGAAEFEWVTATGKDGTLAESFHHQIESSAKTFANVSMLGTQAKDAFDQMAMSFENFHLKNGTKQDDITKAISKANTAYLNVTAPPHRPSSALDRGINALRGLTSFTKLGSSLFTAMYDINATALQHSRRTGENQASAYFKTLKNFLEVLGDKDRTSIGDDFNVQLEFNDAAIAMGGGRGDYDTGFDVVNNFFTKAYKLTGVPLQTKMSRMTGALGQGKIFKDMVDKGFDSLNPYELDALARYKISADDIKMIKKFAKPDKGRDVISARHISEMPLEAFDTRTRAALKKRSDLYFKLSNFIDDSVQAGTPTPDARTKIMLFKGKEQDTRVKQTANLVMQFKETAMKIALDNMDSYKHFASIGGYSKANREVFMYMMMGFTSYALIDSAKRMAYNQKSISEQIASGEKDAMRSLFFDYINKSSALPLMTDFVDAGTSPYFGDNALRYMAGPNLGMVQDAFGVIKSPSRKSVGKFAKRHMFMSNWVPYKAFERHNLEYDWMTGQKIRK
jgi:hypothetical protein